MKDFPWRVILSFLLGGTLAIIIAANWSNPDDPAAGSVIGLFCAFTGIFAGMWWQFRHEDRQIGGDK